MRARNIFAIGLGIGALVLSTVPSGTAFASDSAASLQAVHASTSSVGAASVSAKSKCSTTKGTDAGNAITSQDITDFGIESYTSTPFKCKGSKKARTVTKIAWDGQYYNCPDSTCQADSFNVFIFPTSTAGSLEEPSDAGPVCQWDAQSYTGIPGPGLQTFKIAKLTGPKCVLKKNKTYHAGVQSIQAFGTDGQYGTEIANSSATPQSDFQNPDDGFGTGCVNFENDKTMNDCIALGVPNEAMIRVNSAS